MSVVDDIIFITSYKSDSERFIQILKETYSDRRQSSGYEFDPSLVRKLPDNGNKAACLYVYHLGLNHLNEECKEALKGEPWRKGTLLYFGGECYLEPWTGDEAPDITVWGVQVERK